MKTLTPILLLVLTLGIFVGCSSDKADSSQKVASAAIVDVTALDFKFEAPEEIASGWSTFRFTNKGKQEHFFYIYQLPPNKTYQQFIRDAIAPLNSVWAEYAAGDISRADAEAKLGQEIAPWFFTDIVPSGGPALTEPGEVSQTTVNLAPGLYVVECYVKMPDGSWHTELGMQQPMTVTEKKNGVEAPVADMELVLSNYNITMKGELSAGIRTIAVNVKENPKGFMMHDINLFRLGNSDKIEDIVKWMDWMDLAQFRAPAPAYSLGGVEHLAAGKTGYMTVNLIPGEYAWVSEGYASRGMVKTFTVK